MQTEMRITCLDRLEEILVPGERKIGIVPSLQKQLDTAHFDGLVDLPEDLVEAEHIPVARSDFAIERAEVALRDADVRVVDVAVDDVGDDRIGVLSTSDAIGK